MPNAGRTADAAGNRVGAGQPRPGEDARQPTAAERVRTLVESNASATLGIPGADLEELGAAAPVARAVTEDGDVLLLMPGDSPAARAAARGHSPSYRWGDPHPAVVPQGLAAREVPPGGAQDDDLTVVMEITDVAPVAVPHRIRGRAWVAGWLTPVPDAERAASAMLLAERHPVGELLGLGEEARQEAPPGGYGRPAWTLLKLEVGEASVEDLWGSQSVEPDEFATAEPDPLVAHEAELLQHLAAAHGEHVRGLCGLLDERADRVCGLRDRIVPVALDRFGLRVRFMGDGRAFDARFDFPEPVRDIVGLRRAMHALFEAALAAD